MSSYFASASLFSFNACNSHILFMTSGVWIARRLRLGNSKPRIVLLDEALVAAGIRAWWLASQTGSFNFSTAQNHRDSHVFRDLIEYAIHSRIEVIRLKVAPTIQQIHLEEVPCLWQEIFGVPPASSRTSSISRNGLACYSATSLLFYAWPCFHLLSMTCPANLHLNSSSKK